MWLTGSPEPPVETLALENPRETAFMRYFRTGPHRSASVPRFGPWTALDGISPLLIAAVVKAEDPAFFTHRGIHWRSVAAALGTAVRLRRKAVGASTITQQLARNLYLTPDRSLRRKAREAILALRIHRNISKARTLELYLNVIEWGAGVWGCAAASDYYFRKRPSDLDLFDSTFLASAIAAPKAALTGRNAARSHGRQLSLTYRLFVSGLADGNECAACSHRVWRLHHLLARGESFDAALAAARDVTPGEDGVLLNQLAIDVGIRRIDPAELLSTHCGDAQQGAVLDRLRARVGDDALLQLLHTNDSGLVRQRLGGGAPIGAPPSLGV
jgi:monofunctional biosynthetic peptidoglycan transglycosylase